MKLTTKENDALLIATTDVVNVIETVESIGPLAEIGPELTDLKIKCQTVIDLIPLEAPVIGTPSGAAGTTVGGAPLFRAQVEAGADLP